jgi:phosphohistidine phosphatase
MTRTLYLLRHAKAEPHSLFKSDFDRVLAEQGRADAIALGGWLFNHPTRLRGDEGGESIPHLFDHIICSSAARTCQTLEYLKQGMGEQGAVFENIQYEKKLYHASAETMLGVLRLTPPDAQRVLMVGHNPGISELAAMLASRGDAKLIDDIKLGMPTCTLAIFEFDCQSWQEAGPTNSEIVGFWVV